jgi:hypothetical protein
MKMISGTTSQRITCCWMDCPKAGDTDHAARVYEPTRTLHYLFCSERHLLYWVNSHVSLGNLPAGSKTSGGLVNGR